MGFVENSVLSSIVGPMAISFNMNLLLSLYTSKSNPANSTRQNPNFVRWKIKMPIRRPTPNLRLAERIVRQLFEQELLGETDRALFIQNLAEGRLREGDWKAALACPLPLKGKRIKN